MRFELADIKSIGKTGGSPPAREACRIADGGKDLLHGSRDFKGSIEGRHGLSYVGGKFNPAGRQVGWLWLSAGGFASADLFFRGINFFNSFKNMPPVAQNPQLKN
jgi:hypothetical protein